MGIGVTVIALICTIILVTFQRWVVRKTQSQAVRADMLHYQSDVMMNGAILIALGLSWYGWHRADALFALGIGIYILYSALRMGMRRCSHYWIARCPMRNDRKLLIS
ncbi:transmembrane efflux protein [Salmonella enterica subsp. enterica]|uniref:Transmembrane efflux protein n=1 Tax=Salmonella enterica I TaxID=59201 RepID=A0A379X2Y1_SALET|nr:transmembrane efflux protein [Salmonella enterica subsp. enterica]